MPFTNSRMAYSEKCESLVNTRDSLYFRAIKNPEIRQYGQKTGFKFYLAMKIQRISERQTRLSLFSPKRKF